MRTIVVDDEKLMLKRFERLSKDIENINIVGQFDNAKDALEFCENHKVDLAFLDVEMPITNGIVLANSLKQIRKDILIVFISAFDNYIWDSNKVGSDYYIVKPYTKETLEMVMEKIRLLSYRQHKPLYIQTFGRFLVYRDGEPLKLRGKAKEILALVVTRRGKEISNEEIYCTLWEDREYSNDHMSVYYNALGRLRKFLKENNLESLLISTARGQLVDTQMFDCDYYDWVDKNPKDRDRFEGEFMAEYSWGEYYLNEIGELIDEI